MCPVGLASSTRLHVITENELWIVALTLVQMNALLKGSGVEHELCVKVSKLFPFYCCITKSSVFAAAEAVGFQCPFSLLLSVQNSFPIRMAFPWIRVSHNQSGFVGLSVGSQAFGWLSCSSEHVRAFLCAGHGSRQEWLVVCCAKEEEGVCLAGERGRTGWSFVPWLLSEQNADHLWRVALPLPVGGRSDVPSFICLF